MKISSLSWSTTLIRKKLKSLSKKMNSSAIILVNSPPFINLWENINKLWQIKKKLINMEWSYQIKVGAICSWSSILQLLLYLKLWRKKDKINPAVLTNIKLDWELRNYLIISTVWTISDDRLYNLWSNIRWEQKEKMKYSNWKTQTIHSMNMQILLLNKHKLLSTGNKQDSLNCVLRKLI